MRPKQHEKEPPLFVLVWKGVWHSSSSLHLAWKPWQRNRWGLLEGTITGLYKGSICLWIRFLLEPGQVWGSTLCRGMSPVVVLLKKGLSYR